MTARKEKRKVTRKVPHSGDSDRAVVTGKGRSSSAKATSVYSALNGSFRVFYPIGPTRTSKTVLTKKVRSVVATMKD